MHEIYRVSWYLHVKAGTTVRFQRFEKFFNSKEVADAFVAEHEKARRVLGLIDDGKPECVAVFVEGA